MPAGDGLVGRWAGRHARNLPRAGRLTRMDLGIEGRVALVTGGSRGIGRAIADALEAEGARVVTAARHGADHVYDAADLDAIGPLCDAVGPVDVLVLNTGGPPLDPDPLSFAAADWELAHRTLVIAPML